MKAMLSKHGTFCLPFAGEPPSVDWWGKPKTLHTHYCGMLSRQGQPRDAS